METSHGKLKSAPYTLPGTSGQAYLMLPVRIIVTSFFVVLMYPVLLPVSLLRAIYLRCVRGKPSQILKYGTYNDSHMDAMHYPCQQLFKEPLEETRLRKALVELCAEDGIDEKGIFLKFWEEQPNDWPSTGSFPMDHFIESNKRGDSDGRHYVAFLGEGKQRGEPSAKVCLHVWNGLKGKPTVAFFGGSANKWDGSSNFNFIKELMNRYMGNPPNSVFQKPEITSSAASKFDEPSFLAFLLSMPLNLARTTFFLVWGGVRSAKWAGGNGIGPRISAMNFTKEESARLYSGAKALGVKPFAVMTYAATKACKEILGEQPLGITQQASLQTRHFPMSGQVTRDLVGDWLFGPVQEVPAQYGLKEAMEGYTELQKDLEEIGPITRDSIMAKAYGLVNSGAALFEVLPTYNTWSHCLNRCLFMNNYGVRTMPPGTPFHTWNWNAPLWLGLNTINVDGCTTTLIGSSFHGLKVVEAMRDHIEATLRGEVMAAGKSAETIPTYRPLV